MMAEASEITRRGIALFRIGRDEQAVEALTQAVARHPAENGAWHHLAASLWRLGRRRPAVGVLRDALLVQPDCAETWFQLAASLNALGATEPAGAAVAEALQLDPTHPGAGRLAEHLGPAVVLLEVTGDQPAGAVDHLGIAALNALRRAVARGGEPAAVALGPLARLSPARARAALAELLSSGRPEDRRACVEVVVAGAGRVLDRYESLLRELLADPDEAVRELTESRLVEALPTADPLLPVAFLDLFDEDGPVAREWLESWLVGGRWADCEHAEVVLERCLCHRAAAVREAVLAGTAAGAAEEPLRRLYSRGEPALRRATLTGFERCGATDLLASALWDDNPILRREAANKLAALADPEALPALRDRLTSDEDAPDVIVAVKAAISAIEAGEKG